MTNIILPDSPSSVLQLMNADKKALDQFAGAIINDVKDGRENPLEIALLVKKYEYVLKSITEAIKVNVNTEAAKYGDKPFEYGSAQMHYTPTSTSYDFTVCNDQQLNELESKTADLKTAIDSRKEFLKTLKEPISFINNETGEVESVSPPNKKQGMGLKVTLK